MSHAIDLEEEFAKTSLKRKTFGRLLRYAKPYKRQVLTAVLLEVVWVLSMVTDAILVHHAVDGPLREGNLGGTALYVGAILCNLAIRSFSTRMELRASTSLGVSVLDDVRRDVFDHVQRLSMRYFDRTKQGRIIARADRDVDSLEQLLFWGPIIVSMAIVSLSVAIGRLVSLNAGLAVWLVAALPLVFVITRVFHHLAFPAYRRIRESQSVITAHVAESITGVRVIQAFRAETRERDKLNRLQQDYRKEVMHGARVSGAYWPSLGIAYHFVLVIILWIGSGEVASGALTIGGLLEFILLLGFVLGPIEGLGGLYNECLVAGAAAERIFLLLDTDPEVADRDTAIDPGRLQGHIEFRNVFFRYDPEGKEGWQLEDVNFTVTPGKTVALVGHTGAGKTSVINLLARFYEATEGKVLLDGRDIRDVTLEALHRQTGIVLQTNFLFAGSVLENLRFVAPGISAEEALKGFEQLGCQHVLGRLVDGLATDVGERGANLSEGERQIVCFVRALLARPSLLIFDEATSAVDTRTEATILEAMKKLAARQTTVVIAHRLSTIKEADQILVMESGRIVERGTHAELLSRQGVYCRLYSEYAA